MCIQFVLIISVFYSPRFIPLGPSQKVILPTSFIISSFLLSSAAVTHGVQMLLSKCPRARGHPLVRAWAWGHPRVHRHGAILVSTGVGPSSCPWAWGHLRVHGKPTSGHSHQRKIALPHLSANNWSARGGPWEPLPTQHSKCCLLDRSSVCYHSC